MLPVNVSGDRFEQEANRAADAVVRGESSRTATASSPISTLQRAGNGSSARFIDADRVGGVLRSNGERLGHDTRSMMEDRLGFDFSRVRVHTDAQAAQSARAINARAYTIGSDVVFGAGEYAPRTRDGQRLIAHELTHVRQQASAPPMLQRWGLFDEIAGLFAGDTFDSKTLTQYLGDLNAQGKIEDHSDSDNKARAIVAGWKKDKTAFNLSPRIKALLIKEMQAGFCTTDDELAILDLLTSASDDELTQFFTKEGVSAKALDSDFHFAENDKLRAFFADRFDGGFERLKEGKVAVKSGGAAKAAGPSAAKAKAEPDKPRLDYVFIMGDTKRDAFYREAAKYFRIHYPQADMIVDERTLDGVLAYIDRNIKDPVGHLYIVSHGNEDGTLSFGLDEGDRIRDPKNPRSLRGDSHLSPMELKEALHPEGGGKSTLRDVSGKIDGKSTIHIRGCDLGQNKEFVNLIDEAFGSKGHVIASTHEQVYGTDPVLAGRARAKARQDIEDSEPLPPAVDPAIKDQAAKRKAMLERAKALKERRARINQKLKDQKADIDAAAALGGSYEAMSGVVMQRPGNQKFSEAEVKTEIERRYQHLNKQQRGRLIADVVRTQRVDTQTFLRFRANVPTNSAQALAVFAPQMRKASFVPDRKKDVDITTTKQDDGTETKTYKFYDRNGGYLETEISEIPADDKKIVREAQGDSPNPQNFTWEVKRVRAGALLSVSAVGTRVFADLHHRSLNAGPNQPFSPSEDNPLFYVKSTQEPKDAKARSAKKDDKNKKDDKKQ